MAKSLDDAQRELAASRMNTPADDLCLGLQRKRAVEKALRDMPPPLEDGYELFDNGTRKNFCICPRCRKDFIQWSNAVAVKYKSTNPCAEYALYCRACFPAILLEPEPPTFAPKASAAFDKALTAEQIAKCFKAFEQTGDFKKAIDACGVKPIGPPAPKFKVGDRVRHRLGSIDATVMSVATDGYVTLAFDDYAGTSTYSPDELLALVPTEPHLRDSCPELYADFMRRDDAFLRECIRRGNDKFSWSGIDKYTWHGVAGVLCARAILEERAK